ncbi:ATP-dependent zinc metalloprotease FtsH [Actinomycetes bacterium]|nr:ATP-dependent zinc metalloprotease FtsH [Actinomycetes bacterium]
MIEKVLAKVKKYLKSPLTWLVVAMLLAIGYTQIMNLSKSFKVVDTSTVLSVISGKQADSVLLVDKEQLIRVVLKAGVMIDGASKLEASYITAQEPQIVELLAQNPPPKKWNVKVPTQSLLVSLIFTLLPFLLIGFIFFFVMSRAQGAGKAFSFGKSRAKLNSKETPQTKFEDVAGVDEAIEELREIKDFLVAPEKYQELGAKIPKGVLLYGPPGTGKTLLAKAVAGEASVPFYSISGSDFVEMFVGVGASRVRDLFAQARLNAPAIVFVDEIDAVGRHRGAGMGGGHDEREQTLNQLLVEMDGFEANGSVILIAATNRPDILDPALLRPGRFDRQIAVERPDLKGRNEILKIHTKNKPLADGVDLLALARRTPGFTGADLANVVNEAALLTARKEEKVISNEALAESVDRVMAGPQKTSRLMSDNERLITAYHEGGHALVAHALPNTDPVQKITIMPRGRALGYTMVLPDEDKYSQSRAQLLDELAYTLGGRAAEELIFHDPTTGAANDIEKASALARAMVTQYGLSEKIGAIKLGSKDGEPFMGMNYGHQRDYSESLAAIVDQEVKTLIEGAHLEAYEILENNRDVLDGLVKRLMDKETLEKEEILELFAQVKARPARAAWTGSPLRKPSNRPAIVYEKPSLDG